jgi:6,7-dimethyl-8-ribityllumazine synthase
MPEPSQNTPPPVAIVVSRYNDSITSSLRDAAIEAYTERYGAGGPLAVIDAPGAFELPAIASAAIQSGLYAGVVCLGCVIKGETTHDAHLNSAVAEALASLSVAAGLPVAFGVLTCQNADQARARAGGAKGNKGREAMTAVLQSLDAIRAIEDAADAERPAFEFTLDRAPSDKAGDA